MLAWAAAYVVIAAAAAVVVLARREPTIVRGDWIFLLTALFVLLAAIVTAITSGRFSLGELAGVVVVLIAGWFVQARWWVVGAAPTTVGSAVDECASRLCAPLTRTENDTIVTVPGGTIRMRIGPAGESTVIVFMSSAKHRKVALFRRLLSKQYRAVMPTLKVGDSPSGQG